MLQLLIGGLLVVALGQLAFGRDRSAVRLASYSLLLALTVVNLFVFFYDQFSAILPASLELVLLIGGYRYQRRFLLDEPVLLSPLPGDDPPLIHVSRLTAFLSDTPSAIFSFHCPGSRFGLAIRIRLYLSVICPGESPEVDGWCWRVSC